MHKGSFVFPLLSIPVACYFRHSHHKEHRTAVLLCILYLAIVGTTSWTLYLHIIFSGEAYTHLIFNQTVVLLLSYKGADTLWISNLASCVTEKYVFPSGAVCFHSMKSRKAVNALSIFMESNPMFYFLICAFSVRCQKASVETFSLIFVFILLLCLGFEHFLKIFSLNNELWVQHILGKHFPDPDLKVYSMWFLINFLQSKDNV